MFIKVFYSLGSNLDKTKDANADSIEDKERENKENKAGNGTGQHFTTSLGFFGVTRSGDKLESGEASKDQENAATNTNSPLEEEAKKGIFVSIGNATNGGVDFGASASVATNRLGRDNGWKDEKKGCDGQNVEDFFYHGF